MAYTIAAASLIVALYAMSLYAAPRQEPTIVCADEATRERMRGLMVDGLDEALRGQAKVLFENMMRDPSSQPVRARRGMDETATAYLRTYENMRAWNPPTC
jgi:hypothetical protein